jgi:biopolymer transport protein ExbD
MLNVMLGILAFFVMITMMLSDARGIDVELPGDPDTQPNQIEETEPFVVRLSSPGQLELNDRPVSRTDLDQRIQAYLAQTKDNGVFILADPDVPYEQVVQFLGEMKQIGGDRVSLAIE